MKAIKLNENMIARENRHFIHRNTDTFVLDLAIEPLFGHAITEEIYRTQRMLTLQVTKSNNPEMWADIKELANDALMDYIANMLNEVLPVAKKFEERERNPIKERVIQETIQYEGQEPETKIWVYGEEGFDEAKQRTGHDENLINKPNEFEEEYKRLSNKYPVTEFQEGLDHLISMNVNAVYTIRLG